MGANPGDGLIYFIARFGPKSRYYMMHSSDIARNKQPALQASSDLAWGMWNRVTTTESIRNIKKFLSKDVVNLQTEYIINRILSRMGKHEADIWPGIEFRYDLDAEEEEELEDAYALLGSCHLPFLALTYIGLT